MMQSRESTPASTRGKDLQEKKPEEKKEKSEQC